MLASVHGRIVARWEKVKRENVIWLVCCVFVEQSRLVVSERTARFHSVGQISGKDTRRHIAGLDTTRDRSEDSRCSWIDGVASACTGLWYLGGFAVSEAIESSAGDERVKVEQRSTSGAWATDTWTPDKCVLMEAVAKLG